MYLCPNDNRHSADFRPTKTERDDGLTAGDLGHGGAHQGHQRVRNSRAHTMVALSTAAAAQNGGDKHGRNDNNKKSSAAVHKSECQASRDYKGTTLTLWRQGDGRSCSGDEEACRP